MKRFVFSAIAATLFVLVGPQAHAACDATALNGAYGFHLVGYTSGHIVAAVGRFVANGAGKLTTITDTVNAGNSITRFETYQGMYYVNGDCTGTLSMHSVAMGLLNLDFVLVNGNTEIFLTAGEQGGVYGEAVVQGAGTCSLAGLNGAYGFHQGGLGALFSFVTEAGRFVADGAGKLPTITDSISIGGSVIRGEWNTGSYDVNPDCTGSLLLRSATNSTIHYDFVFVNGNNRLFMVGTDPGSMRFLSSAVKQ